jgi:hypothetical protein
MTASKKKLQPAIPRMRKQSEMLLSGILKTTNMKSKKFSKGVYFEANETMTNNNVYYDIKLF